MKTLFSFLIIPGILLLQSCSKQSAHEVIIPIAPDVIEATIAPNHTYQVNLNSGTGSIVKQALHYQVSKTEMDEKTGSLIYTYTPLLDYKGMEEVVISKSQVTNAGNSGCSNNHNDNSSTRTSTTYTTIRLTIAN